MGPAALAVAVGEGIVNNKMAAIVEVLVVGVEFRMAMDVELGVRHRWEVDSGPFQPK